MVEHRFGEHVDMAERADLLSLEDSLENIWVSISDAFLAQQPVVDRVVRDQEGLRETLHPGQKSEQVAVDGAIVYGEVDAAGVAEGTPQRADRVVGGEKEHERQKADQRGLHRYERPAADPPKPR